MRLLLVFTLIYSGLCFAGATEDFISIEKVVVKKMKSTSLTSITVNFDKEQLKNELITMLQNQENISKIEKKAGLLNFYPTCEMWERSVKNRYQDLDFLDIECENKFKEHKVQECDHGGCFPGIEYEVIKIKGVAKFVNQY